MEPLERAPTPRDESTAQSDYCPTCGGHLSDLYPDYATLARTGDHRLLPQAVRDSAKLGCTFCKIVFGVWEDCQKQFDCTLNYEHTPNYDWVEELTVCLRLQGEDYILVLDKVWMPVLGNLDTTSYWGKVLIYRQGTG